MNQLVRPVKKQCNSKQGYETESLASGAMDRLVGGHESFNVYECPHCCKWHFGHKIHQQE